MSLQERPSNSPSTCIPVMRKRQRGTRLTLFSPLSITTGGRSPETRMPQLEEVVSAARRIGRILEERPTSGMEQIIQSMQNQIQILTKDLAKAHEQMTSQVAAVTPTAAFAAPPSNAVPAAQAPPATSPPASLPVPAPTATPLPPLATVQLPLYPPGRSPYLDYGDEGPYFRPPRRQLDRRPPQCFLCDEEGHFACRCPARTLLQRLLRQQARETAQGPPRGQVLEVPALEGSQGSPRGI